MGWTQTHGKHHDNFPFAFHYDRQIESHLKALERFMDEDVLDLIRRDEACCGSGQVGG